MTSTAYHGLLVLDKPLGMTSRTAVDRAQLWFPRGTRLGHTGTLDPLATGVLVLCVGVATRLTEYVQDMAKGYRTTFRFGAVSATDDGEGPITTMTVERPPTRADIERLLPSFLGEIDQVPPAFSAAKVSGERAYDRARQGEEFSLAARKIRIDAIDIVRFEYPELELDVRCGKGTYIRSLARDLGQRLGCGGMVQTLRRTHVGPFSVENALTPDANPEETRARLLPLIEAVPGLPRITLRPDELGRFRDGRGVPLRLPEGAPDEWAILDAAGGLIAVGRYEARRGVLLSVKMLA